MTRRTTLGPTPRERAGSAVAVAVVTGGLGWLLAGALALHMPRTVTRALTAFDVLPPPPPPPREPPPPRRTAARTRQAPAPAGKRAVPTPIVAPVPVVVLPVPPVVATAPVAGIGTATSAGAADRGSGTGAGGEGNGRGGGGDGGTGARQLNELPRRNLPPAARLLDGTFVVKMRFVVQPNGRVSDCNVVRTSGHADLDAQTCALIVAKLRYAPARDAAGRKIPFVIDDAEQRWEISHGTGDEDDAGR